MSDNDRSRLFGKTKDQLIEEVLRLKARLADVEKRQVAAGAPKKPHDSDSDQRVLVRSGEAAFSLNTGFLAVTETVHEIFHSTFSPWDDLKQFTSFKAFRPDGTEYTRAAWPFMRSIRHGELVRDEEMQIVLADGTRIIVLVSSQEIRGFVNIQFKEITGQRRIEQALQESDDRYRQLFENMRDGFFLAEPVYDDTGRPVDWRFLDANPAYASITGLSREQVIGQRNSEICGDSEPFWCQTIAEVAETGRPTNLEVFSKRKGRWYVIRCYSPYPHMTAAIVSDVTEHKKAEEALLKNRAACERENSGEE